MPITERDVAYWERNYALTIIDTGNADALSLHKAERSDWCTIEMTTNGRPNGTICIRSREQLEMLAAALNRMLDLS